MRLGGEVHDGVDARHRAGDSGGVLDPGVHELDVEALEVLAPSGVGELVEHGDRVAVVAQPDAHERRADEPGAAADEQLHREDHLRVGPRRRAARCIAPAPRRRYAARPSCQRGSTSGSGRSLPSTLYAGRRAGRGNASRRRQAARGSPRPARWKISSANSFHEHWPAPAMWCMPVSAGARRARRARRRDGRSRSGSRPGRSRRRPRRARRRARASCRRSSCRRRRTATAVRTIAWSRVRVGDLPLAGELRLAVDAERRDRIGLQPRLALGAVEDVVGRDVDDPRADVCRRGGDVARARAR